MKINLHFSHVMSLFQILFFISIYIEFILASSQAKTQQPWSLIAKMTSKQ